MILDALNLGLAGAVSFLEQQVGVFGYKAVGGGSSPESLTERFALPMTRS